MKKYLLLAVVLMGRFSFLETGFAIEPDGGQRGGKQDNSLPLPKEIKSTELQFLLVDAHLMSLVDVEKKYDFVHAVIKETADGRQVLSITLKKDVRDWREKPIKREFLTSENILAQAEGLLRDHKAASDNGTNKFTQGLPDNFGGRLEAFYESGEKIIVSNNQDLPFSFEIVKGIVKMAEELAAAEETALEELREESDDPWRCVKCSEQNNGGTICAGCGRDREQTNCPDCGTDTRGELKCPGCGKFMRYKIQDDR